MSCFPLPPQRWGVLGAADGGVGGASLSRRSAGRLRQMEGVPPDTRAIASGGETGPARRGRNPAFDVPEDFADMGELDRDRFAILAKGAE